ncbi:MAG: aminopeptidase, partial [Bacteroidales bacterium]|nr:aminopeptidase [Bacteroidales bacterium]
MMKFSKIFTFIIAMMIAYSGMAQDDTSKSKAYKFTDVIKLKNTPVKNQYRSGTCWSYSGLSFLESELLNAGKAEYDL